MDYQHYTCSTLLWLWRQHKKLHADDNWLTASIIKHGQSRGDDVDKAARHLSWALELPYLYLSYRSDTGFSSEWRWHHYSGPRWRGLLFGGCGFIPRPGGGLTYAPDLFPELYLWSGMMAEIFGQQCHTETLTEDQETNAATHQRQAEKKWPDSQWNTAASHHLNVASIRWSLHVASWLLASNGYWTGNNGIIGGKKKVSTWKGTTKTSNFWVVYAMRFIIRGAGLKRCREGDLVWVRWSAIH